MANLSYADLSYTIISGNTFRDYQLNLSYSNLTGADLTGLDERYLYLHEAILDNAIWVDGRICA